MFRLALSTLRSRKQTFAGALVALVFASMLVATCAILMESAVRADAPTERYADTPIVVAGDQSTEFVHGQGEDRETESLPLPERVGVEPEVADRLRELPEVGSVVADVSVPARIARDGEPVPVVDDLWAHGWDSATLTPFALTAGRAPEAPNEVVVDAGLAARGGLQPGDQVTLSSTDPTPRPVDIVGVATPQGGARIERQSALFLAPTEARRLAGGRVDALGVLPADGQSTDAAKEAVEEAVGGADVEVHTGRSRGEVEFPDIVLANADMIGLTGSFGGTAMMIAVFVVAGTFAFSVQQRYRELGLLRAVGATPRQVRRMITREAAIVAVLGAVIGFLPGVWMTRLLRDQFVDRDVVPDTFVVKVGWIPLLVTLGTALVTSQIAVFAAGRRAGRIRPTEALSEAGAPPRRVGPVRIALGILFVAGGLAALVASQAVHGEEAMGLSVVVVMLLMVGAALLGPLIARVLTAAASPLLVALSDSSGFLAAANARSDARRLASVFTPVVLCVALACTLLFIQTTQRHETEEQGRDRGVADHVLRAEPGLPTDLVENVRARPGVRAAVGIAPTSVLTRSTEWPAQAVTPDGLDDVLSLDPISGELADLRGRTVALSEMSADAAGKQVGDTIDIRLGDGTDVEANVVAIYRRSLGFADYLLPFDLVADHLSTPLLDSILVRGSDGAELDGLADSWPGVQLLDMTQLRGEEQHEADLEAWVNFLLVGVLVGFTAISVANTLVMATTGRTREFALLRLSGATRRQVLRMVRWETLLVVAIAAVLGSAIAAATLIPFSAALTRSPVPYVPPLLYGAVLAGTAALGLLASLVPTRAVLRAAPADTMRGA